MKPQIQVDDPFASLVDQALLERAVAETLTTLGITHETEVGILLTDDETVRELNRQYRDLDETTDVLSFSLGPTNDFPLPPGTPPQLGEVVISCPQAQRQAEEVGHSLEKELSQLLVHGLLHLLGYDHEEAAEAEQMRSLEGTIGRRLIL